MTEVKVPDAGGDTITMTDVGGFLQPTFMKPPEEIKPIFDNVPNFQFRDDDLMLCTYAKTGTNWMFEILMMIQKRSAERVTINKSATMLEYKSVEQVDEIPSPRVINCHFPPRQIPNQTDTAAAPSHPHKRQIQKVPSVFHKKEYFKHAYIPTQAMNDILDGLNFAYYKGRYLPIADMKSKQIKTVLCLRNPKDTAVSYYNHMKAIKLYDYTGKWENWIPVYSQGKLEYGKYSEYLLEWQRLVENDPGFPLHVMYYEDLKTNGHEELEKLLTFLGIDIDDKLKEDILDMCGFEKMAEEKGNDEIIKLFVKEEFKFFRKGQIGDWKNWFTVAQNEIFDEIWDRETKYLSVFEFKYT